MQVQSTYAGSLYTKKGIQAGDMQFHYVLSHVYMQVRYIPSRVYTHVIHAASLIQMRIYMRDCRPKVAYVYAHTFMHGKTHTCGKAYFWVYGI